MNNRGDKTRYTIHHSTTIYQILKIGLPMAKTNYSYEKRARELEKEKKKEEKRKKKQAQKDGETQEQDTSDTSDTVISK